MTVPGHWYPDPADPERLRYWDGARWTDHTAVRIGPGDIYKTARIAAGISVIGAAGVAVLQVVAAAEVGPSYDRYEDAASRGEDPFLVWTTYDTASVLLAGLLLAAGIATCVWSAVVRRNAEVLRPMAAHKRGRAWAWAGWICPVVNLWFPYQVVRDVERATGAGGRRTAWWWVTWIVFALTFGLGDPPYDAGVAELNDLRGTAVAFESAAAVAAVLAAAFWFVIVRRVSADQASAHAKTVRSPDVPAGPSGPVAGG